MKNKFIVSVDQFSDENVRIFAEFLKCYGCGWWHWIQNIWLVIDYTEKLTAEIIANKLNEIEKNTNNLVFKIDNIQKWHGYGPKIEDSTYFKWIRENWSG